MTSLAFARRPKWIAAHIFVLAAVSLFCVAGFWQLSRLEQRRAHNSLVRERRAMPPMTSMPGPEDEQRRVRLQGRYTSPQIVLTGRSLHGSPGDHLLTPLETADGAILVDRGWVPPGERILPPDGTVTVEGIVLPSERGGGIAGDDRISRINLELLGEKAPRLDLPLVYVLLQRQEPSQREPSQKEPRPVEPAALSEKNHLSYAVQWFSFTPTALVVYALLLRREARKREVAVSSGPD